MPEKVKITKETRPAVIPRRSEDLEVPERIVSALENSTSMDRSLADWRTVLTKECQVYVIGEQYIGKRFDQIYYKYMGVDEAKEVLTDNLYAILYYKYFDRITDEVSDRVTEIVKEMTKNLKTFLTKITFNPNDYNGGMVVKQVPISAVAFANGIFDFNENRFILKYERIFVKEINNTIILYSGYIIMWCFDFEFTPLPFSIMDTSFSEFVEFAQSMDKDISQNYCWELFWNMTHDQSNKPSYERMVHLSQILGYTLVSQFLQYFILLIGSGQNGKNSLFDGCFSCHVHPAPVSNSIEAIENDRFITESLQNACHNIFLETSPKTYSASTVLKALTGSMYQTIECKGVGKYSGVINCKYIFAGNDQSKIKFSDATKGFRRRINLFEIYYTWDDEHRFMRRGDYYPCDFSGDLHELKEDPSNCIMYIYLGMYGILSATERFAKDFKFGYNEWNEAYSDIEISAKDFFDNELTCAELMKWTSPSAFIASDMLKQAFYSEDEKRLYLDSEVQSTYGIKDWNDFCKTFSGTVTRSVTDDEGDVREIEVNAFEDYLSEHDCYISLVYLRSIGMRRKMQGIGEKPADFNDNFRKMYPCATIKSISTAQRGAYVKCHLVNGMIKFIDR